jgi:cytochrome P450
LIEFSPYDYAFHEDPYPLYKRLREEAPVYHNAEVDFWALSRHADVLEGFKNTDVYSNARGVSIDQTNVGNPELTMFMLAMDPPRHLKYRALVSRAFTGKRVDNLEPRIREIANGHALAARESGNCDYIADFAGKLPMDVVSEMLDVPAADRDDLRSWSDDVMHREDGFVGIPDAAIQASAKLLQYFAAFVADRRKGNGDGLIEALLAAEVDGEHLTDANVVSFLFVMIIAGNETTTKLLANAIYWASKHEGVRADVEADPALIPGWVEETLRYDNSSQILGRVTTRDLDIRGTTIPEGDRVLLLVGAANRDPDVFEAPDRFDLRRDCSESLSFGKGVHFCLGARLARLEGQIGLEATLEHFPNYEIDFENLVRVHSSNVRGFSSMPIGFDR